MACRVGGGGKVGKVGGGAASTLGSTTTVYLELEHTSHPHFVYNTAPAPFHVSTLPELLNALC